MLLFRFLLPLFSIMQTGAGMKSDFNTRRTIAMLASEGYSVRWSKEIDSYIIERDNVFVMEMTDNMFRYAKFDVIEVVNECARERGIKL